MPAGWKASLAALAVAWLLASSAVAQSQVEFRLHAPSLPDTCKVYIAGNVAALGEWVANRVPMHRDGRADWVLKVKVDEGQRLEYKYTLGDWARESLDPNGQVRGNWHVVATGNVLVADTVQHWRAGAVPRKVEGKVTGKVHYLRHVQPIGLSARDIVVWLPPGFKAHSKRGYPVLYLHDGQNILDPTTSSFGVDWRVDETCDSLIRHKAIPPMIVVGVYNSGDRRDEYSPGEKGTLYMDFLIHQLKPMIDSLYPTRADARHTYVAGSSMGGLISFMLAWEHPEVFSKAICMSPAFQYKGFDYVPKVTQATTKPAIHCYIDNGGEGLETVLQPGCEAMLNALKAAGYRLNHDYYWVQDPAANHFESAWAKRLPNALVLLLKNH